MNVLTTQGHFFLPRVARLTAGVETIRIRLIFLTTSGEAAHIAGHPAPGLTSHLAKPVDCHQSKAIYSAGIFWLNLNQSPGAV